VQFYRNTIVIHQPYFYPYLGYFQNIAASDIFIMYDDVKYIKNGFINRNRITNGEVIKYITIPSERIRLDSLIYKVKVGENFKANQIIDVLNDYYRKAPNKLEILSLVEEGLNTTSSFLCDWVERSLILTMQYLGLLDDRRQVIRSVNLPNNKSLKGEEKVIDICKLLSGDQYINAAGGKDLYNSQNFEKYGIKLNFIRPKLTLYKGHKGLQPLGLSIIDVLMFNELEKVKEWVNNYELI
jgi:hypothetical protein